MRVRSRAVAVLALTVAATIALTACSSKSGADTITLYNGQHEQTADALINAFTAQTGIKVKVRNDDEDVLAQQIEQEGAASPADVFYTENSPALEELSGKGLLAPVDAATLQAVPSQYSSPQGDWLGVSARVSMLVYNTDSLPKDQLPTSIMDLADPKWSGKLALAPGETDFQPIVTSIVKAKGEAAALTWLKAVKANGSSHDYPDNETIVAKVNSGDIQIGLINNYYWYRLQAQLGGADKMHSALATFAPQDPGYIVNVSGAGIIKASKHQADAQKFLAFLASTKGQQTMASSDSFEYPVIAGVTPADNQAPLASLQPYPMTISDLGNGAEALKLLQEAQML
jgi:iron(III) transport system substrate-binding protein